MGSPLSFISGSDNISGGSLSLSLSRSYVLATARAWLWFTTCIRICLKTLVFAYILTIVCSKTSYCHKKKVNTTAFYSFIWASIFSINLQSVWSLTIFLSWTLLSTSLGPKVWYVLRTSLFSNEKKAHTIKLFTENSSMVIPRWNIQINWLYLAPQNPRVLPT